MEVLDYVTEAQALELASSLVSVAERYPRTLVQERDFYPAVLVALQLLTSGVQPEWTVGDGNKQIDFCTTRTTNPVAIELAVAPIKIGDESLPQLSRSTNESELRKLANAGNFRKRYLLLIDLNGRDLQSLEDKYLAFWHKTVDPDGAGSAISVVAASSAGAWSFRVPRDRRRTPAL